MESAVIRQGFTTFWHIATAIALTCAEFSLPAAAQTLDCPVSQPLPSKGVLKESAHQITETSSLLASGDAVNRVPEMIADLRKRYPGVADGEIVNYLVTAYCPIAAKLNGLSVVEQQSLVDRFSHQAVAAVYGR